MTTQLYLQKAEMQLSRGLEEKALESLLSALACQNRDTVSETQTRCLLGEYQFVHQQYVQAQEQFSWISDRAEQLEHDYVFLLWERLLVGGQGYSSAARGYGCLFRFRKANHGKTPLKRAF